MKRILFILSLVFILGSSAYAEELKDISGYEFEKEILILQSLGIVNGDENGCFKPSEYVKRSEAAKLIDITFSYSGTLYEQAETGFSDVPSSHWASGYIKSAVDRGFINGMGDENFAPDSDITFAQACTIIMKALGYGMFAESSGGYPDAYIKYAEIVNITDKLVINADMPLTKGELAYMIANALETPVTEVSADGRFFNIMHGVGEDYRCPLNKYHHAYWVSGMITETSRSGGRLRNGYVNLEVAYAKRLANEYINLPTNVYCNTVDGDAIYDLLYLKGDFILTTSDTGEYVIIMIII